MKSKFLFGLAIGMFFFGLGATWTQPLAGWVVVAISVAGIYGQAMQPGMIKEVWAEFKPYYHNLKTRLFS